MVRMSTAAAAVAGAVVTSAVVVSLHITPYSVDIELIYAIRQARLCDV